MGIYRKRQCEHKTLYRYYACTGENQSRIEARLLGEIFFSSPLKFNDPYDCQLPHILNNTKDVCKRRVLDALKEEGFDANEIYNELCLEKNQNVVEKVYRRQAELLGIFCMTDSCNNALMWSHYAQNAGMCIEYDMNVLCEQLYPAIKSIIHTPKGNFSEKRILMSNVVYDNSLSLATKLFFEDYHDAIEECKLKYWHKHKIWRYENEYRIGISLGGNLAVTIPNMVKRVFLGCNTNMGQIAGIRSICKRHNLDILIYIMRKSSIGLVPEEISSNFLDKIMIQYQDADTPFWHNCETEIKLIK